MERLRGCLSSLSDPPNWMMIVPVPCSSSLCGGRLAWGDCISWDAGGHLLYWTSCATIDETYYLIAIINSNTLREMVEPLMSKGQFGARDMHKHLWRLPIPEFDGPDSTHVTVADAGRQAALGVERELGDLR